MHGSARTVARLIEEEGLPILVEFRDVQPSGPSPEKLPYDGGMQLAESAEFDDSELERLGK